MKSSPHILQISENSKIGDTDISSIGSTVTGAIKNLSEPKLVLEVVNNGTRVWAEAIDQIKNAALQLSSNELMNSFITLGSGEVFQLSKIDINDIIYTFSFTYDSSNVEFVSNWSIRLNAFHYDRCTIRTTYVEFTSQTDDVQETSISLYTVN